MKKQTAIFHLCLLALVLVFTICGCVDKTKKDDAVPGDTVSQKIDENNTEIPAVSLESVISQDPILFDNVHVEVRIYADLNYCFTNRNVDFFEKMTSFVRNTSVFSRQTQKNDNACFYVVIDDGDKLSSFSVFENDDILVENNFYTSEGIYKEFEKTFRPFMEENGKYCRSATTTVKMLDEYAIFDKNKNILESDTISKTPYLFYRDGIVHRWYQAGTGGLTQCAKFFDVEKGLASPDYYGQTDWYGNMVCATEASRVVLYDMFSGEQICTFDTFEKTLGDCVENIISAYFSKDGKQVVVEYLNIDYETEKQVFEVLIMK